MVMLKETNAGGVRRRMKSHFEMLVSWKDAVKDTRTGPL